MSDLTRFDHWMAQALYGPRGYYTSPRPLLGFRGDFTTTPKTSPLLAQKLAEMVGACPVIELGPGDGTLAEDLRTSLGFWKRHQLDYHFVEISPHLRERQRERFGCRAGWHDTLAEALEVVGGEALILSNEFFDAFPARIFQDGRELYLDQKGGEHWQPCPRLPEAEALSPSHSWPPGQRLEVLETVHEWYQTQLSGFRKGRMVTVDYGGQIHDLYHRRPGGTLRAYFHHQRLYPPEAYANPGHQDLTTDVCFDDLRQWGEAAGLQTLSLQNQASFLGLSDRSAEAAFQVLVQEKT